MDFIGVQVETFEVDQFVDVLEMFDLVVADVQNLQLLKLIHILNLGYLVFLQVQLAQSVTQWQ